MERASDAAHVRVGPRLTLLNLTLSLCAIVCEGLAAARSAVPTGYRLLHSKRPHEELRVFNARGNLGGEVRGVPKSLLLSRSYFKKIKRKLFSLRSRYLFSTVRCFYRLKYRPDTQTPLESTDPRYCTVMYTLYSSRRASYRSYRTVYMCTSSNCEVVRACAHITGLA